MAKIGFRIIACLALWLISAQGQPAFAAISEAILTEEDSGSELKETSGPGLAYIDQRNTFRVEPGPQKEFQPVFSPFPADASASSEAREQKPTAYDLFLRDVRHNLKMQIFPFHFFW